MSLDSNSISVVGSVAGLAISGKVAGRSLLAYLRQQMDGIEVNDYKLAKSICQIIPASCPFARDIYLFNRLICQIPPLCKLNPLYEQLVSLRFKSLSYLADVCGEDVGVYFS